MGGSPKPQVTQVPTMIPEQESLLKLLLGLMPQAMTGQTIGGAYGGPGQANYSPFTIGAGKGGQTPSPRSRPGGPRGSPLDSALTGPIVSPFTQGQTGNYPNRRM